MKKKLLTIIREEESKNFKNYLEKETGQAVTMEHRFAPPRRWAFDFAIQSLMIAIEVEGGVFSNGRHTRGKGYMGDMEKYNVANELGWSILRYSPDQKYKADTITQVKKVITKRINENILCRL